MSYVSLSVCASVVRSNLQSVGHILLLLIFLGVADGVGGWRAYGIDPGEFSSYLMRTCQRLVELGHFSPSKPAGLLARSYYELLEHKKPILGEFCKSSFTISPIHMEIN